MPSLTARVFDLVLRMMPETGEDFQAERARNAKRKAPKLPKDVTFEEITLGGQPAELLEKNGNTKGRVFYIHGGGFTTGSAAERRSLTQHITDRYGYNCVSINYRLAPENKWPAQLEDCFAAWQDLCVRGNDPAQTVLMGESAGATLVLSLSLYLKEKGLPQPKALVAYSPSVTQAEHYPSHFENAKTDFMLKDNVQKGLQGPLFSGQPSEEELRSPLLSPVYGDYAGLPPVFLAASDSEVLFDDSRELYKKLIAEGHPAKLDIAHCVCHAFPIFPVMPEAQNCIRHTFAYLEEF